MSGGMLDLPCKGFLTGCCFRRGVSKAGSTAGLGIGTLEAPRESGKSQIAPFDDIRKWELWEKLFYSGIFEFFDNIQLQTFLSIQRFLT